MPKRELGRASWPGLPCAAALLWLLVDCGSKSSTGAPLAAPVVPDTGDAQHSFGSGSRLRAKYRDGGGGAREFLAFYDSELRTDCAFVATQSGEWHCLPTASGGFRFADGACQQPVFDVPSCSALVAGMLVTRTAAAGCAEPVSAYSLGALGTFGALYFTQADGSCAASGATGGALWSLTPEPLTRFVAATQTEEVGAPGGLGALRLHADDGSFITLDLLADGKPCEAVPAGGQTRCVPGPVASPSSMYFADSACSDTNLGVLQYDGAPSCFAPPPSFVAQSNGDRCSADGTLYAVGAQLGDTDVYVQSSACETVAAAGPSLAGSQFYTLGSAADPTQFPQVQTARVGSGALELTYTVDANGAPLVHRPEVDRWTLPDGSVCTPMVDTTDASGVERCVPAASIVLDGFSPYFADSACTDMVYGRASSCGDSYSYMLSLNTLDCAETVDQLLVAEPYNGALFSNDATGCVPATASDGELYYKPGASVDLARLPALSLQVDP